MSASPRAACGRGARHRFAAHVRWCSPTTRSMLRRRKMRRRARRVRRRRPGARGVHQTGRQLVQLAALVCRPSQDLFLWRIRKLKAGFRSTSSRTICVFTSAASSTTARSTKMEMFSQSGPWKPTRRSSSPTSSSTILARGWRQRCHTKGRCCSGALKPASYAKASGSSSARSSTMSTGRLTKVRTDHCLRHHTATTQPPHRLRPRGADHRLHADCRADHCTNHRVQLPR